MTRPPSVAAGRVPGCRVLSRSVAVVAAVGLLAACGSSGGSGSGSGKTAQAGGDFTKGVLDQKFAGQTIHVIVPSYAAMPKASLAQFTQQTGIAVDLQTLDFDSIHDKVATSEAAGVAPADVTEVDWSWVGQFGAAGWYQDLQPFLPTEVVSSSAVSPSFKFGGKQLAMPYSLDFRAMYVNMTLLKAAGIATPPTTWDEVEQDAKTLQARNVLHSPIGVPLSVTEGGATPWYALIKSAGGEILDDSGQPAFTGADSAGAQALAFEKRLYQEQLIPAGAVAINDQKTSDLFAAGQLAIELSFTPGAFSTYLDPKSSKIAKDDVRLVALPGHNGTETGTFGLPEGFGIPKNAAHSGAAAEFIFWWQQPAQLLTSYNDPNMGNFPPSTAVIDGLVKQGKLNGGAAILKILPSVKPLFPKGTPSWYPQFSTDVSTMIQAVVEGKQQPDAGLAALGDKVKSLAK